MTRHKYWLSEFYTDLTDVRRIQGDDKIDMLCAYISTESHEGCILVWADGVRKLSATVTDVLSRLNKED